MDCRGALFWTACIPARVTLTSLATQSLLPLRMYAAVVSYRWTSGLENGHVGGFGGPAWWRDQRLAHGILWGSYAVTDDWRFLAADTVFGALNWISAAATTRRKSSST